MSEENKNRKLQLIITDEDEYEEGQRLRKRRNRFIALGISIVVVIIVILVWLILRYRSYDSYKVVEQYEIDPISEASFYEMEDNLLKVSKNGAIGLDKDGSELFNVAFEISINIKFHLFNLFTALLSSTKEFHRKFSHIRIN